MLTRIEITNYMSHSSTVIEPAAGVTLLVGPNNCGKSAVVDALNTVCGFNDRGGGYMVRHGETKASVTVTTSEGSSVTWIRKNGTVSWEIDGREVHRGMPEDLHEKLKLSKVRAEGREKEFSVHLADQKQPLFLLDSPGSDPAHFFAASSDARHLIAMRQAHKRKTQELATRRKTQEDELGRHDTFLETLSIIPALEEELTGAEIAHKRIQAAIQGTENLGHAVEALTCAQDEYMALARRELVLQKLRLPPTLQDPIPLQALTTGLAREMEDVRHFGDQGTALRPLAAPPSLHPEQQLDAILNSIRATQQALDLCRESNQALSPLASPPVMEDLSPLDRLIKSLKEWTSGEAKALEQSEAMKGMQAPVPLLDETGLEELILRLKGHEGEAQRWACNCSILDQLHQPASMSDPMPLERLVDQIRTATSEFGAAKACTNVMERLEAAPLLADPTSMEAMLATLRSAEAKFTEQREGLNTLEGELEGLRGDIRAWLEANGSCPACGQSLSEDLLTEGGLHGH